MENESDTHNYTHLSLHTRSGRQSVGRAASYARRKRMNEKKKGGKRKKKQNFSNCRTSALGLGLSPSCVARRLLPSHSLAHYACNNNGNRLGQTFFLNSRQVAASGALLLLLLPACLSPGIQGQGDCTSAIWTHNFARLRVSFAAASRSCYLFPRRILLSLLPMKPKNFNEEQPRSVSAYPYRRRKSPLKFPPSSVCTCHLHFNGNAF